MTERGLRVERWRRYGKDRLYVNDEAGQRIGWVDRDSGDATVEVPAQRGEFDAAVAAFEAALRGETATSHAPTDLVASPGQNIANQSSEEPQPISAWHDLALHRPGQAAREQAEAELASMKDRSKVGTFIARTFDMKTEERAWRVGAGGEETVGVRLEKLCKHGWHILHAVPVGSKGSDIDHVVIGSGGVFTINTKTHPGKRIWVSPRQVRVDGHPVPYFRNSRFEAERASRLLTAAAGFPVLAKAALVFLTGSLIPDVTIKGAPDDVVVLDRMDIPGAFKRAPRRLSDEAVASIFEMARRSTTWES